MAEDNKLSTPLLTSFFFSLNISPEEGYIPRGIPRNQSTQHKVLHRLQICRGHLDCVINMVQTGEYCINVINQSQAVQSALSQVDQVMLENHLKTCVARAIEKGDAAETISEVMRVMKKKN